MDGDNVCAKPDIEYKFAMRAYEKVMDTTLSYPAIKGVIRCMIRVQ